MKQYVILLLAVLTFISCSDDDDNDEYHFEYVPVLSADVPDEFVFGRTYTLYVQYELPNSCYYYYSFDYFYDGASREIYPIALVNDTDVCEEVTSEGEFIVRVTASQSEPYLFKFWQGEDEDGEPVFLEIEVPVVF